MASNLFMSTSSKLTTNTTSGGEKATVVDLLVKCGNEIKNQSVAALGKTLCKYESSSRSPLELESQQQQQTPCMLKSAVSSLCRAASNTLLLPSACPTTAAAAAASAPATNNTPSSSSSASSPFIDPSELMKNLCEISKKPCVILLDCRPYTEFNNKHIKDSVHLNCRDKLIKKRLQMQKITIRDLISCELTKSKLDSALLSSCSSSSTDSESSMSESSDDSCSRSSTNSCSSSSSSSSKKQAVECNLNSMILSNHMSNKLDYDKMTTTSTSSRLSNYSISSFNNLSTSSNSSCTSTSTSSSSSSDTDSASDENIIVIYDDTTADDKDLLADSNPLKIVQENLKKAGIRKECKILKGGFKQFAAMCPDLCNNKLELKRPTCAQNFYEQDQHQSMLENTQMTEITPYLYLGNEMDAMNVTRLMQHGVYYILNVTKNVPFYEHSSQQQQPTNNADDSTTTTTTTNNASKFVFKRIPVNDCISQNLKDYFDEAFEFIDEAKRNNSKVLVHCQAGVSRSPTIVIAYLMRQFGISTNDAFNKVREKRPIISPNIVFMSQLMDYESRLKPSLFNQFATRHFSNCAINTSTTSSTAVSDHQQENVVVNINNSVVENSKSSAEANKSPIECN